MIGVFSPPNPLVSKQSEETLEISSTTSSITSSLVNTWELHKMPQQTFNDQRFYTHLGADVAGFEPDWLEKYLPYPLLEYDENFNSEGSLPPTRKLSFSRESFPILEEPYPFESIRTRKIKIDE